MSKVKYWLIAAIMTMALVQAVPSAVDTVYAQDTRLISTQDLGIDYAAATGLGSRDVRETVASIIRVVLGLLGIIAVVIIIVGGFQWMTAGGNEEKAGEAKKRIFAGVIGLAIILSAYALATWVINQLVRATTTGGPPA